MIKVTRVTIKPNKTLLFVTERIKLYGVVVCLKSGKISPEVSKIAALRNRAILKSKKEMKNFWGSLVYFNQIVPIAVELISILHKSTRGEFKLKPMKIFKLRCMRIIYCFLIGQTILVNFIWLVTLLIFTLHG